MVFDLLVAILNRLEQSQYMVWCTPRAFIIFHKATVGVFMLLCMCYYQNFSSNCWFYFSIHGTYGMVWVFKDLTFPDKRFQIKSSLMNIFLMMVVLLLYLVTPWLIASGHGIQEVPGYLMTLCLYVYTLGLFLMLASDCQKYYNLKLRPGLISDGMFKYTRNPNYLGESLIYISFSMSSGHMVSWVINGTMVFVMLRVFMLDKDNKMSSKKGWEAYKKRTWLILPKFFDC